MNTARLEGLPSEGLRRDLVGEKVPNSGHMSRKLSSRWTECTPILANRVFPRHEGRESGLPVGVTVHLHTQ